MYLIYILATALFLAPASSFHSHLRGALQETLLLWFSLHFQFLFSLLAFVFSEAVVFFFVAGSDIALSSFLKIERSPTAG